MRRLIRLLPVWCTAEFDIMMQVSLFSKTYVGADGTCPRPVRKHLSQITSIEVLLAAMNSPAAEECATHGFLPHCQEIAAPLRRNT